MTRHAILHIGPMKTGSSSIQAWLGRRAPELLEDGVLVPLGFGANMSRLAAIAEARVLGMEPTENDLHRLAAFEGELAAMDDRIHKVVISGEMLGHQLRSADQVQVIRKILAPYFDRYTVIPYLRRQDELSLSRYSTALRRGERRARPLSVNIDYEAMLDLWSGVFGAENVKPRLYDRDAMPGGDVVQDFAHVAGLPYVPVPARYSDQNPSLLPEAQTLLAKLAARVREQGFDRSFEAVGGHGAMMKHLSTHYRGKGAMPSRQEAIDFYAGVAESNERVRQKWFPARDRLFSEDFSKYPEAGSPEVPAERMVEVLLDVMAHLVTSRAGLEPNARSGQQVARRELDEKLRGGRHALRRKARRAVDGTPASDADP